VTYWEGTTTVISISWLRIEVQSALKYSSYLFWMSSVRSIKRVWRTCLSFYLWGWIVDIRLRRGILWTIRWPEQLILPCKSQWKQN